MLPKDELYQSVLTVRQIKNIHTLEFDKEHQSITNCVDFREMVYVDSGSVQIESDAYTGPLNDGQALIYRPGQKHTIRSTPKQWTKVVLIGFVCDHEILDRLSIRPMRMSRILQEIIFDVQRENTNIFLPPYGLPYRAEMEIRPGRAFACYQMARLKMESFLIHFIRTFDQPEDSRRQSQAIVEKVHYHISKNATEKITLAELGQMYNINKNALCTLFKRAYGITIIDYINTVRVNRAKVFLRQGDLSITQIAELVGFTSVHYFSRVFKQYTQLSPTAFEKESKK